MSDSRFKITITETTFEKRFKGKDWMKGGDGDPESFGYTPEIVKTVAVERTLYTQNVADLDLVNVIKAVNSM